MTSSHSKATVVYYEHLKEDLEAEVKRLAAFLGVGELTEAKMAAITKRVSERCPILSCDMSCPCVCILEPLDVERERARGRAHTHERARARWRVEERKGEQEQGQERDRERARAREREHEGEREIRFDLRCQQPFESGSSYANNATKRREATLF